MKTYYRQINNALKLKSKTENYQANFIIVGSGRIISINAYHGLKDALLEALHRDTESLNDGLYQPA